MASHQYIPPDNTHYYCIIKFIIILTHYYKKNVDTFTVFHIKLLNITFSLCQEHIGFQFFCEFH